MFLHNKHTAVLEVQILRNDVVLQVVTTATVHYNNQSNEGGHLRSRDITVSNNALILGGIMHIFNEMGIVIMINIMNITAYSIAISE